MLLVAVGFDIANENRCTYLWHYVWKRLW